MTVVREAQDIAKTIQRVLEKLAAEYKPEKVVLFGSHARGTADSDSDVDLLIIKHTSERFIERWAAVQNILTRTHPFIPVEPIVLTSQEIEDRLAIGDQFIEGILAKGVVLYAP